MTIYSILGVAIGLVFVFLTLSLICTSLKELIELLLRKRSADLEAGIRELLDDQFGTGIAKDVFEHPLIFSLFPGEYTPAPQWSRFFKSQTTWYRFFGNFRLSMLPSYIPAKNFAVVLADVVLRPPQEQRAATSNPETLARPVDGTAATSVSGTEASVPVTVPTMQDAINAIQNERVKRALLTLTRGVQNDEAHLRTGIEAWFNSAMDQVSSGYKRWAQTVLFVLGTAISVGLNIDAIAICNRLAKDPDEVKQLLASADKLAQTKNDADAIKNLQQDGQVTPSEVEKKLGSQINQLQELNLAIGWTPQTTPSFTDIRAWMHKIAGLLLTSLAISLGAPFWFDVLSQFMCVRSAVKPRETR